LEQIAQFNAGPGVSAVDEAKGGVRGEPKEAYYYDMCFYHNASL
jgi:hypothetical protein